MHPSDTYRPSFGPGSHSHRDRSSSDRTRSRLSGDEYGEWRAYGEQRGFWERAGDEVASWFGDDDAARRREMDHRGRGPSDYTRSDERIREDVNDRLTHDWRLDASRVRVQVKDGEVSLDGKVDSRMGKRRAEDLAEAVSGVNHVQNNLRVHAGARIEDSSVDNAATGSRVTAGTASGASTGTSTGTVTASTGTTGTR